MLSGRSASRGTPVKESTLPIKSTNKEAEFVKKLLRFSVRRMKILLLVPYPPKQSPSQRFRFEQYFQILSANGHSHYLQSFLSSYYWRIIFNKGNLFRKTVAMLAGFVKRFFILFKIRSFDFVFIHREVAPIGPPIFEWLIANVFQKKIIYDFDDAIWSTDKKEEGKMEKIIRWRSKVKSICKWSYKVSCGNEYLCDYAKQFNSNVILNPTTIDTVHVHNPMLTVKERSNEINIGWTGSHSTLKYLNPIVPIIKSLEQKYPQLRFIVIANKKPELDIQSLVYIPWSITTEVEDLSIIDIGIMPLPDDEWSKGKCGFKLLQYMALNKPALASPVGVNARIIDEGINGYLCDSEESWITKLELLITNEELRQTLGKNGRKTVDKSYSISSNAANFLSLFH
jgi:glycosyltransferase involved in cell wall biosynthesis